MKLSHRGIALAAAALRIAAANRAARAAGQPVANPKTKGAAKSAPAKAA